jgi:hypothetical protein
LKLPLSGGCACGAVRFNLIRALMVRAATLAQVLVRALSFKASVQLWRAFSQR